MALFTEIMSYICSSISSTYLCWTASVHIFFSSSRRHWSSRLHAPKFSLTAWILSRLAVTSVDTWLNRGSTNVSCWSCRETSSLSRRSERLNSCSILSFSFWRSSVVSLNPRDLMTLTRKPQPADYKATQKQSEKIIHYISQKKKKRACSNNNRWCRHQP